MGALLFTLLVVAAKAKHCKIDWKRQRKKNTIQSLKPEKKQTNGAKEMYILQKKKKQNRNRSINYVTRSRADRTAGQHHTVKQEKDKEDALSASNKRNEK